MKGGTVVVGNESHYGNLESIIRQRVETNIPTFLNNPHRQKLISDICSGVPFYKSWTNPNYSLEDIIYPEGAKLKLRARERQNVKTF